MSASNGFAVVDKGPENYEVEIKVQTEFDNLMALFIKQDRQVVMIGEDGKVRKLDWSFESNEPEKYIHEYQIQDAAASIDSNYLALLSNNQRTVTIYKYMNMSEIKKFDMPNPVFLMTFSANSEAIILVSSTEEDTVF